MLFCGVDEGGGRNMTAIKLYDAQTLYKGKEATSPQATIVHHASAANGFQLKTEVLLAVCPVTTTISPDVRIEGDYAAASREHIRWAGCVARIAMHTSTDLIMQLRLVCDWPQNS